MDQTQDFIPSPFTVNENLTDLSFCSDIVCTDVSSNVIDISMCLKTHTEYFDLSLCNLPLNVELFFKYSKDKKIKRIILLIKNKKGKILHNIVSSVNINNKMIEDLSLNILNNDFSKEKCFYHSDSSDSSDSDYYRHLRRIYRHRSHSFDSLSD